MEVILFSEQVGCGTEYEYAPKAGYGVNNFGACYFRLARHCELALVIQFENVSLTLSN